MRFESTYTLTYMIRANLSGFHLRHPSFNVSKGAVAESGSIGASEDSGLGCPSPPSHVKEVGLLARALHWHYRLALTSSSTLSSTIQTK